MEIEMSELTIAETGQSLEATVPRASRKKELKSAIAALPMGPYSQGIQVGGVVFVAGEKGIDPKTGKLVPGGIAAETRQTFENIKAILAEAGATLDDAVAATVHMTDLNDFQAMNVVYGDYFHEAAPGRTTVQVAALPGGAHIEITITAVVGSSIHPQ
jgi:2-iminobutanoate/2-iminopropanoate deaminase